MGTSLDQEGKPLISLVSALLITDELLYLQRTRQTDVDVDVGVGVDVSVSLDVGVGVGVDVDVEVKQWFLRMCFVDNWSFQLS